MSTAAWLLLLAALAVVGLLLQNRAGRMDRLHLRLDAARQALDAQLLRRSTAALELAASNRLDPATSVVLADAAQQAINADDPARASAESAIPAAKAMHVRDILMEGLQRHGDAAAFGMLPGPRAKVFLLSSYLGVLKVELHQLGCATRRRG